MKFNADQVIAERKASLARRSTIRTQILNDQASGAKRDAKALRAEAAWLRRNGK
jgi:hypothetical protein